MSRIGTRFWLITVVALIGATTTLALGFWQWSRAQQRIALHEGMEQRSHAPALDAKALLGAAQPAQLVHYPVVLRGQWLVPHTVYLDNRQMQAKPGFYVVTPLQIEGSQAVVLVQRGWVQRNFEQRDKLPAVDTPTGQVEVRGRIAPPPGKLYEFSGTASGPIRQNLDLTAFGVETHLPLLPVTVQQTGPASEGLLRDWPQAGSGAEKNYGYAFQWWAMSALIVSLYVWFQFIASRRARRLG